MGIAVMSEVLNVVVCKQQNHQVTKIRLTMKVMTIVATI